MKIPVLLLEGRSKNMPQILTMDTRHSWDPEKEASGIKDMPPIMVANGIFVLHKWWKILRIQDIRYSRGKARWAVEYSRRKYSANNPLQWRVLQYWLAVQDHSFRKPALYPRSSHKVVWYKFWRGKWKQTRKCSQDIPRNSNQAGGSQVIGWFSKTTACFGKPNASGFERFQFDAIHEQNWISPYNGEILPSDRERKSLRYKHSRRSRMGESALRCVKNIQRREIGRIQGHTHHLMQNKKLVQSWILGLLQLLMFLVLKCKYHHWVLQDTPHGFW